MNTEDIIDLLTIAQSVDNRTFGEPDVIMWQKVLDGFDRDDCTEAIVAFRREQPDTWLQPGHIVARVKSMRRDRYERTDPDQLPYPGDAKTAPPDPRAGYARGVYVEHDPAGWPYANAATREERANADTELRARVKARIKATPRGETPPTEAEAETAIRLEDRERAERFLRRRDLAGLIEGLGAQPGSTRRPAPAFSEPRRPTNP